VEEMGRWLEAVMDNMYQIRREKLEDDWKVRGCREVMDIWRTAYIYMFADYSVHLNGSLNLLASMQANNEKVDKGKPIFSGSPIAASCDGRLDIQVGSGRIIRPTRE
jgi:hypothetical protein